MISIRQADIHDAEAVFTLLCELSTSCRPDRGVFDGTFERVLASMTYDDGVDLLVAEDDGRVVGYALASRSLTFHANGPVAELQEIVVEPRRRGTGVGCRLVAAIAGRAKENGVVELTAPTRRAGDFYRTLGFTESAAYFRLPMAREAE